MHTPQNMTKTLDLLWNNYLVLASQVDTQSMDPDLLAEHRQQHTPTQPLRLATWLTRQSFFLSAWSLWEQYSASVCTGADSDRPKSKHVEWVRDAMSARGITFRECQWFLDARCVRNLIAHYAGRVDNQKTRKWLETGRKAFPGIDTYSDGYLHLTHDHVAELQVKIEEYVDESVQQDAWRATK